MRLIEPEELAAEWKVPMSWIYGKCRERALPHLKLGHFLRFDEATLGEWLEQHRRAVKPHHLVQEERVGAAKKARRQQEHTTQAKGAALPRGEGDEDEVG